MVHMSERILRILGAAVEPLYPFEITEILNRGPSSAYSRSEVIAYLQTLTEEVTQLVDGRWSLRR
jgi:hypothetical protein